jgi:hypothetical protein
MVERILADQRRRDVASDDPSEASPPSIGEASPMPEMPPSQWTRTQALPCAGVSPGDQRIWKASTFSIFIFRPRLARGRARQNKEQDQAIEKVQFPVQEQRG